MNNDKNCQQNLAYQELANAIIIQAIKDYRQICRILSRNPDNKLEQHKKKNIEAFFVSDYFAAITNLDGHVLLQKLKARHRAQEASDKKSEKKPSGFITS